jgi:hypothetical protein
MFAPGRLSQPSLMLLSKALPTQVKNPSYAHPRVGSWPYLHTYTRSDYSF